MGEHILLGGDNIDLALARFVEQQLAGRNVKLDSLQLYQLWQQCRVAKERLLEDGREGGTRGHHPGAGHRPDRAGPSRPSCCGTTCTRFC